MLCFVQSGAVMNRSFQPHESHVPFLLQFKVGLKLPIKSRVLISVMNNVQSCSHVLCHSQSLIMLIKLCMSIL